MEFMFQLFKILVYAKSFYAGKTDNRLFYVYYVIKVIGNYVLFTSYTFKTPAKAIFYAVYVK